jgi:hypothetical protein
LRTATDPLSCALVAKEPNKRKIAMTVLESKFAFHLMISRALEGTRIRLFGYC